MKAIKDIPNWIWQQLGYTIERMPSIHPRTSQPTDMHRRIISRPDSSDAA